MEAWYKIQFDYIRAVRMQTHEHSTTKMEKYMSVILNTHILWLLSLLFFFIQHFFFLFAFCHIILLKCLLSSIEILYELCCMYKHILHSFLLFFSSCCFFFSLQISVSKIIVTQKLLYIIYFYFIFHEIFELNRTWNIKKRKKSFFFGKI